MGGNRYFGLLQARSLLTVSSVSTHMCWSRPLFELDWLANFFEHYLLAYFDILGFKSKLKREKLETVHMLYLRLIEEAVKPQQAEWSKNVALTSDGDLVPALMWAPIEVAYASDSLLLYVHYHPSFVEEFLRRSALLFCLALRAHVP